MVSSQIFQYSLHSAECDVELDPVNRSSELILSGHPYGTSLKPNKSVIFGQMFPWWGENVSLFNNV